MRMFELPVKLLDKSEIEFRLFLFDQFPGALICLHSGLNGYYVKHIPKPDVKTKLMIRLDRQEVINKLGSHYNG